MTNLLALKDVSISFKKPYHPVVKKANISVQKEKKSKNRYKKSSKLL